MAEIFCSLFLIGLGILSMFLSAKSLMNPEFARRYFENSPKAWLGRKIFGDKKASDINRKIIFPLGIIFGFGFIFAGILLFVL